MVHSTASNGSMDVGTCLRCELVGGDTTGLQQKGPAAQKDEPEEPRSNVEGGNNACCQVELMHDDAEDGPQDCSCE